MTDGGEEQEENGGEIDYSTCDYYRRELGVPGYAAGTCSFGCYEEPGCVTGDYKSPQQRAAVLARLTKEYHIRMATGRDLP